MSQTYNDFLGEVLQETYRENGKPRQPNINNSISKRRRALADKIDAEAANAPEGMDDADIALDYVKKNIGGCQKYVVSKGEMPLSDPISLAIQAYKLRREEIKKFSEILDTSEQDAEHYLEEAESKAADINSPEADSFLGEIFDALGRVAGKGLKKLADKRTAKGKKPGLVGFLADMTAPKEDVYGPAPEPLQEKSGGGFENVLNEAKNIFEKIKENEKKKEINKMLPIIIVGVLVLIFATVLITKSASKR
jgi:hypothetical protein